MEEANAALLADAAAERKRDAAQQEVQRPRLKGEALGARIRGLAKKGIENEDDVRAAYDSLIAAMEPWARAHVADFRAEYVRAVTDLATVLGKGVAIADALGADDLGAALRRTRLYDPDNLMRSLVDMEPTRIHKESGMVERYAAWEDDPAATAVYEDLVPVRLKCEQLRRIDMAIRERRDAEARAEMARLRADESRPKTVAYEVHYPQEYSPLPEVEVIQAGKAS